MVHHHTAITVTRPESRWLSVSRVFALPCQSHCLCVHPASNIIASYLRQQAPPTATAFALTFTRIKAGTCAEQGAF